MSSNKDDDDDDDDDDETMSQNEIIKETNDILDEIIGKSKSFEKHIKLLEKVKNLDQYFINDFDDKELKSKIFKLIFLTS